MLFSLVSNVLFLDNLSDVPATCLRRESLQSTPCLGYVRRLDVLDIFDRVILARSIGH